jgi:regulator of RNase E activity RraB
MMLSLNNNKEILEMKTLTRYEWHGDDFGMCETEGGRYVLYSDVQAVLMENLYKLEMLQTQVEELMALVEACTPEATTGAK